MTERRTPPAKRVPRKATPPMPPKADEPTGEAPAAPLPDGIPAVPVYVAWAAVMRDVEKITKDELNRTPGASFKFRGIDATMNTVGPVLRKHGVIVVPHKVEMIEAERYDTKSGAQMHGVITKHVWNVFGPLGDGFLMETLGQAADSGDKAISKAASVAYRTALLQSLTVPTGDRDPDADSHDRAPDDPRQEQWDRISGLAKYARQSPEAIRKHYREKMGHEIDGPDATVASLTEYGDRLEASFKKQAEKLAAQQADEPSADPQNTTADAPSEPPAAEQAPADVPAQPEAQTPAQGRDRRQKLWDDILAHASRAKMNAEQVRVHFRDWSRDAADGPLEIDGPVEVTTSDILTRYAHVLRKHADEVTS